MAVAAEFILPSGCHVRIMDDDIDYSPEAQERVMERFWRVVRGQIAAQLDAGVPYEEIKRRIAEASAQADGGLYHNKTVHAGKRQRVREAGTNEDEMQNLRRVVERIGKGKDEGRQVRMYGL